MFWKWFRLILLGVICATIYFVAQFGIPFLQNPVPPVGKLVNPYTGFWQNDSNYDDMPKEVNSIRLSEPVQVIWDERLVPHIFAQNNYDLYFTQGYIHAKHRLWQMDFISRVSGGRLSEIVGIKAKEYDLFHRRIGLLASAQLQLEVLKKHPDQLKALEAYADGVNTLISELDPKDYPIEFKLMNYKPEKWSPLKSALILKYMAWDLDGSYQRGNLRNSQKYLTDSVFQELYPLENPFYDPIIPESITTTKRRQRQNPIPSYQYQFGSYSQPTANVSFSKQFLPSFLTDIDPDYQKGSNNWVVSGKKTRSGNPILANDPHLSLSLPSLWYENQLMNPEMNVYGVSLPGVPMIVIGFNEDVAWGFTYCTSDPIDFTRIEMNEDKTQYKIDEQWENLLVREDTIRVLGASNAIYKTLITKVGPIIYQDSIPKFDFNSIVPDPNVAMNWTAQYATHEFEAMYKLNRAKNFAEYKKAIQGFTSPGQNFAFASKDGDIAIWHNGGFPIRPMEQARFIVDTLKSEQIWTDYIPFNELPHSINPSRGYLSSANQSPVKGNYPYYLGSDDYSSFERGNRINQVLDSLNAIVPFDFQKLQLDNYSLLAEKFMPLFIQQIELMQLNDDEKDAFAELKAWNYKYSPYSKAPVIFNHLYRTVFNLIWNDEVPQNISWKRPRVDVTLNLILTDPESEFIDNKQTPNVEDLHQIVSQAFEETVKDIVEQYGSLNEKWRWADVNPTKIKSLANIKGFGSENLITGGSKRNVNAISGHHGPSWRMIVEVGEQPKAYGVYPGGQSGNPGSSNYDNFIDDWESGNYFEIQFLTDELNERNWPTTYFFPDK